MNVSFFFSAQSKKNILPVASEEVIDEIGQHASFQEIINQLQCKDGLVLKKTLG